MAAGNNTKFYVPENARRSKIASAAHTPETATAIDATEKKNTTLKNVLPKTMQAPIRTSEF